MTSLTHAGFLLISILGADPVTGFNQFQPVAEPITMTIEECLTKASEVNVDLTIPFMAVCLPVAKSQEPPVV